MILSVITPTADILGNPQEPNTISNDDSQLLYGEQFDVIESHGAYVLGKSIIDGYQGYVERDQLIKNAPKTNAFVCVPITHIYEAPHFKSRPIMPISMMSRLSLTNEEQDGFIKATNGDWYYKDHIQMIGTKHDLLNLAETALQFLHTPYLYGGRSAFGIDCSGLVQISMMAAGYPTPPRDCKDQAIAIGSAVEHDDLKRNDLVYFKGHVGIMVDNKNILNATARHMNTLVEPLKDLEKSYDGVTDIRRI